MPRKKEEKKFEEEEIDFSASASPGELYKKIEPTIKEIPEAKLGQKKEKKELFAAFCKNINSRFPSLGKNSKYSPSMNEAMNFLGWELKPEEFFSGIKFVFFTALIIGIIISTIISFAFSTPIGEYFEAIGIPIPPMFLFYFISILIALFIMNFFQNYPFSEVKKEQVKALRYVPEIVGYMIMSMKLVPNLEKAIEFAAEHGKGKIADDLKKMIWDTQLGVYNTLSEGLDALAYKWGNYSEEFKLALMRIRASVLESSEAKRFQLLDSTMDKVLEGVREKMENYARSLNQPAIVLFYMGVLLPLILIIVLPVGSAFTGQALARPDLLFALYDIAIPLAAFLFARRIISNRPPTYSAPSIPDNYPELPGKGSMLIGKAKVSIILLVFLIGIMGIMFTAYAHFNGIGMPVSTAKGLNESLSLNLDFSPSQETFYLIEPDKTEQRVIEKAFQNSNYFEENGRFVEERTARGMQLELAIQQAGIEKQRFLSLPENDTTPNILIYGIIITIALCVFLYLYYSSYYKRKVQKEFEKMETEFKDSLYILASRMAENKPVEEAINHVREFLPQLTISKTVYAKTSENITLLGMPLEKALFDPTHGSLKENPSDVIKGSMKLLVDSIQLGGNVAARTLISMSVQLTNSEKVTKMLSILVSDTAQMMKSMALFIGPIVLGITVALQKVVMNVLGKITSSGLTSQLSTMETSGLVGTGFDSFTKMSTGLSVKPEVFASMTTPTQFLFIVAIYVIEIVAILVYFTTRISEDNELETKMEIAKAIPIAIIAFLFAVILSNAVVASGIV